MEPRQSNSNRWTALPPELVTQIKEIFTENFGNKLGSASLIVEGRIYPEELLFRAGFLDKDRLRQRNFEVSLDFDPKKENALKQIHLAIDCAASMMDEFLSAESKTVWDDFPKIWQEADVQGKKVFLQVSAINSKLEAEADRILGQSEGHLVEGEDEELERQAVVTMLGLGQDEEE
jgi:hypothetical protein